MANRIKREMSNGGAGGTPQPNAWLIHAAGQVEPFAVTIAVAPALIRDVAEGDGVALLRQYEGKMLVTLFAGIYRLRRGLRRRQVLFRRDGMGRAAARGDDAGIHSMGAIITRVDWATYIAALRAATDKEFADLPAGGEDRRGTGLRGGDYSNLQRSLMT